MLTSLEDRLEKKLGRNYLERDFEITSNINTKKARGSVRMILGKVYTPKKREEKIDRMLSIKLPR
ncbi:hypothetical protein [Hydrogenimonas sp.]